MTLDISHLQPQTEATLIFDFIGGDQDVNGGVRVDAVSLTLSVEYVPVDIKPTSCRNPFNVTKKGVLPVAILGTENFDVTQVNVNTVQLEGIAPLRSSLEDVATPFVPFIGKTDPFDCTTEGQDGFLDLSLKFDAPALSTVLGPVTDGAVRVLSLTGSLLPEFGGTSIVGEDVVVILKKKYKGKD